MKAPRFLRTKGNRLMFFGSILVICVSATIYFALQEETYAEQFLSQFFQPKVSKFLLIAIPAIVGVIVLGVSNEIFSGDLHDWMKGEKDDEKTAKESIQNIEPELEILYDSLKERYQKRYDSKLDGRFEITLEVNEDWRFDKPATYKFSAEAKVSEAAAAVRKAFDDKGRLLIVGNAGSGKTVLLLKLALGLLGDGYETDKQIPVIFNLASWRETHENFEDWLIEVLNTGNGLSKDFAKTVLREKKIIFLLDGLDELARNAEPQRANEIRAKCMESLNDYLREGRRTVICCRREQFAAMQKTTAQDAPVSAKVEVLDLTKADIILALQQAQTHNESRAAAENLEKLIETNEIVLEVLSTPFYFTTALEVFDKPNFNDKNLPTDADELKTYLLKNYVENKLKYTAKLTEFEKDPNKIKHWLIWLARLMEKKHLVNFELADLQPTDLDKKWHYQLVSGLNFGLVGGLLGGLNFGLVFGLNFGLNFGLVFGLLGGLGGGLLGGLGGGLGSGLGGGLSLIYTEDNLTLDISLKSLKEILFFGLVGGLVFGLVYGLVVGFLGGLVFGLVISLIFGLVIGFVIRLDELKKIKPIVDIESPYQRITSGFKLNTTVTLIYMFLIILVISLVTFSSDSFMVESDFKDFVRHAPYHVLVFLSLPILNVSKMPVFLHSYLRHCLWFEGSMPLKYATFLDLAAEARILEKEGGQWRFRHQNLQEYFAKLETEK